MSSDTEIIKIPQPLKALDDLLPGDIILFVMPRTRKSLIGRVIDAAMRFFQSLVGASHGHQNIGHTRTIYRMRDAALREEFVGQLMSVITDREEVKKAKFRFRIVIESWLRRMANTMNVIRELLSNVVYETKFIKRLLPHSLNHFSFLDVCHQ